ncbi:MotA/TolQ/ExbB proton channel family protein [Fusobacterium nucleatum]|uniref:MotA/TolQ/ExbB proton channel family protein n=1 Tax=Fusobacterium nucleatum TaxID=851 RepID=UPI0030D4B0BE
MKNEKNFIYFLFAITCILSLGGQFYLMNFKILEMFNFFNINVIFFWLIFGIFIYFTLFNKKIKNQERTIKELDDIKAFFEEEELNGKEITERELLKIKNEFFYKEEDIEKYPILSKSWKEYSSTFLKTSDNKYYQVSDAEDLFNENSLIKEKMNMKILNYIPQLFVGLGIFGTFLGLSLGLSHINLRDTGDLGQINNLIEGVQTSFYTSLYGMFFSISITLLFNNYMSQIEKRIFILRDKLNSLFFLNNGGEIIQDMRNELKEIRAYNSEMASQITNGINKELVQMTTVLDNKISGITSGITGTFQQTMSENLEKIFSADFIKNFENIKDELLETSRENNQFIAEYKNEMKEIVTTTKSLKDEFLVFADEINQKYNDTNENLKENFEKISVVLNDVREIHSGINEFTEDVQFIASENKKIISDFKDVSVNLKEFAEGQDTILNLWRGYRDNFASFEESINSNFENYQKILEDVSDKYGNKIDKLTTEYVKTMNMGMEDVFRGYDNHITEVIEKFQGVLKSFKENLELSDDNLKNNLDLLQANLEDQSKLSEINNGISEKNRVLLEKIEKTQQHLANLEEKGDR